MSKSALNLSNRVTDAVLQTTTALNGTAEVRTVRSADENEAGETMLLVILRACEDKKESGKLGA